MSNAGFRATRIALTFAALGMLAVPAVAQERPLGEEAREEELDESRREMERHRREMERHREEMERHARAMREALMRAHRDSAGEMRMFYRDGAFDSAQNRFIYSARLRTPCARIGIAFDGVDTIVVREVMPGSGADDAGIRAGDVIVRVDGERASIRTMTELAEGLEAGDEVRLVVRRAGGEQTIDVTAQEDICPYRTMLSEHPFQFQMTCLKGDSSGAADPDEDCTHEFAYELRRGFEEMHERMPLRMFMESGDSGMMLRYFGPEGGDSFFIDLDSVRMMSEAVVLQLDSLQRLMPFSVHVADSLRMLMPRMELNLRDAEAAMHAQGVMLRSLELGARALAGAHITDLSSDLAEYFEVEEGVLVTRVDDGTPAARAGLRGGDVIVTINGNDVVELGDVHRHAGTVSGPLEIVVVRRGERRTVRLAE